MEERTPAQRDDEIMKLVELQHFLTMCQALYKQAATSEEKAVIVADAIEFMKPICTVEEVERAMAIFEN